MEQLSSVLIRIDDIGLDQPLHDQLIYELCAAGLRVTCAIVPTWLTSQCAAFINLIANQFPEHLEVHQHGYSHTNYSDDDNAEYEFGSRRSFDEQLKDILHGRQILENSFGPLFFPAFTPPYGVYNYDTLLALREASFQAISGCYDDEPSAILPGYAPTIDCFYWHPTREKAWTEIVAEWQVNCHLQVTGLILHPRLMSLESVAHFSTNLPLLIKGYATTTFADLSIGTGRCLEW